MLSPVTASSSTVVAFTQRFPTWEGFNRWREAWLSAVIADPKIRHRAKTVATVVYLHLNKDSGVAFPGYTEIARCAGILPQNAVKGIDELIAAGRLGKLLRQNPDGSETSNFYVPAGTVTTSIPFSQRESPPSHSENLTHYILTPIAGSDSQIENQERSLPSGPSGRREEKQGFPSATPSSSAFNTNGVPRGPYVGFASPLMPRLEEWERRTGKSFPRDKRGGWLLTPEQWAAVEAMGA